MFSKSERISRTEFSPVYQRAERYHSPSLTLCYVPREKRKVSVVVSKKVAKQAVTRNRLRRQLYEALQRMLGNSTGVFIVITKPPISSKTMKAVVVELDSLYRRITKST